MYLTTARHAAVVSPYLCRSQLARRRASGKFGKLTRAPNVRDDRHRAHSAQLKVLALPSRNLCPVAIAASFGSARPKSGGAAARIADALGRDGYEADSKLGPRARGPQASDDFVRSDAARSGSVQCAQHGHRLGGESPSWKLVTVTKRTARAEPRGTVWKEAGSEAAGRRTETG